VHASTHRLAWLFRRLQEMRIPVAAVHHLDALHRHAPDLATEWACSAGCAVRESGPVARSAE
jgi:hypothetical protein